MTEQQTPPTDLLLEGPVLFDDLGQRYQFLACPETIADKGWELDATPVKWMPAGYVVKHYVDQPPPLRPRKRERGKP